MLTWPSNADEVAPTDWVEVVVPDEDGPEYVSTKYRLNVSFLLSGYQCIFGKCPGVLATGAKVETGCCQLGVHFIDWDNEDGSEDFANVQNSVSQLVPGVDMDAERYDKYVKNGTWYTKTSSGKPHKTRVQGGACIFANRVEGSAGKPGCAFHHLANRTGQHHIDTKPEICWSIPLAVNEEGADEETGQNIVTISPTPGYRWGGQGTEDTDGIGYWCVETPDAYVGTSPVYKSMEQEFRAQVGDHDYEAIAAVLDEIKERRYPMPGETINGGRPLIPLLVKERVQKWEEKGMKTELKNSARYLSEHPLDGRDAEPEAEAATTE